MEYDSEENVWREVCSLPETLTSITSSAEWRDMIFISGYAKGSVELLYMLKPPPKGSAAGAQGENFGKWEAIQRPQQSHVDYSFQEISFAVTVEI